MSIESKVTLLNELSRRLSSVLTAADLSRVISAMSDVLAAYDVSQADPVDASADDLLDAYISAIQIQGRSPKTIDRYRYIITRMMTSVRVPTRQITVYHLRRYLSDEKARGISDRTLESTRQVFSAYFNWLHRESLIPANPTANLGAIKYRKEEKTCYSDVDLERMKRAATSPRDRAIIAFLSATGCRVSEMTQLNRDDVDLISMESRVLGKGNKERTVYLSPVACMAIREYLDSRTDASPALFAGRGSDRITPHGVRRMLTHMSEINNLVHVHPHKFRRTLATNLIRHGMPIQEVAVILGHDKLDTTMQYVVMDKSEIKHAYSKYA